MQGILVPQGVQLNHNYYIVLLNFNVNTQQLIECLYLTKQTYLGRHDLESLSDNNYILHHTLKMWHALYRPLSNSMPNSINPGSMHLLCVNFMWRGLERERRLVRVGVKVHTFLCCSPSFTPCGGQSVNHRTPSSSPSLVSSTSSSPDIGLHVFRAPWFSVVFELLECNCCSQWGCGVDRNHLLYLKFTSSGVPGGAFTSSIVR